MLHREPRFRHSMVVSLLLPLQILMLHRIISLVVPNRPTLVDRQHSGLLKMVLSLVGLTLRTHQRGHNTILSSKPVMQMLLNRNMQMRLPNIFKQWQQLEVISSSNCIRFNRTCTNNRGPCLAISNHKSVHQLEFQVF